MIDFNLSTSIIIILVASWFLQLLLTYFQMKRFYKQVNKLRSKGITSIGMAGSFLGGRIYTVLVINQNEIVVDAKKLSGFTVFANLKRVDEIIGKQMNEILDLSIEQPMRKKVRESFIVAVKEINKRKESERIENPI